MLSCSMGLTPCRPRVWRTFSTTDQPYMWAQQVRSTWCSDLKNTIGRITTRSNHARTEITLTLYLGHLISYNLKEYLYLAILVGEIT